MSELNENKWINYFKLMVSRKFSDLVLLPKGDANDELNKNNKRWS